MDELVSCLKSTFPKARTEATFQSIDKSMAKFKGRSTLKQYVPLKPIKRGIKNGKGVILTTAIVMTSIIMLVKISKM